MDIKQNLNQPRDTLQGLQKPEKNDSNWGLASLAPFSAMFLAPLGSNQPRLSRTLLRSKETLVNIGESGIVVKARWQDVLEDEKRIDVFTVTKAKSDWLDLPLPMQKATSCWYLLIYYVYYFKFTITPEI